MAPRGIRGNNPGNIDFNQAAFVRDPWQGEVGLEDHPQARFTTFESPEHGIRALCKIVLTYYRRYDLDTVRGIINRWAPPTENDSGAYVDHVAAVLGVGPDEPLPLDKIGAAGVILTGLARAIIIHENGQQPYDDATILAGVEMAMA